MKMIFWPFLAASVTACTIADFGHGVKVIKVICGLSEVLLSETDSDKIKSQFGEDSFAGAVCDFFAPTGGMSSDNGPIGRTKLSATLPNGDKINAIVQPLE